MQKAMFCNVKDLISYFNMPVSAWQEAICHSRMSRKTYTSEISY